MDSFQKDIDDRANLTLSNRFELLLFRLGTSQHEQKSELYGINVFKLREIVPMPVFTRPAGMKSPLLGMVNIRDQVIPVIDLPAVAGCKPATGLNILLLILVGWQLFKSQYASACGISLIVLLGDTLKWHRIRQTVKN